MSRNSILLSLHRRLLAFARLNVRNSPRMVRSFKSFSSPRGVTSICAVDARRLRSKDGSNVPCERGAVPGGLQVSSGKISPHGAMLPGVLGMPKWFRGHFAHPCARRTLARASGEARCAVLWATVP